MSDRIEEFKERLLDFALRSLRLYRALPKCQEARAYGGQLLRSSSSVGANHREACRARSTAEFVAKIGDCLKELDESDYWLELVARAELLPRERLNGLQDECREPIAIFTTIIKRARK